MPKVKSFSAAWLSSNTPGHRLFEPSEASRSRALETGYSSRKKPIPGPRRTIARRGTEIFVAVGREIRWGDLAYLKDEWAANRHAKGRSGSAIRIKREESTPPFDDDGNLESTAGLRASRMLSSQSRRSANRCVGYQDTSCGRHSTAHHFTQLEFPSHLDDTHRTYLRSPGSLPSDQRGCWSSQAQDLYTGAYYSCHLQACHCVCPVAPAWSQRLLHRHSYGGRHCASLGIVYI